MKQIHTDIAASSLSVFSEPLPVAKNLKCGAQFFSFRAFRRANSELICYTQHVEINGWKEKNCIQTPKKCNNKLHENVRRRKATKKKCERIDRDFSFGKANGHVSSNSIGTNEQLTVNYLYNFMQKITFAPSNGTI